MATRKKGVSGLDKAIQSKKKVLAKLKSEQTEKKRAEKKRKMLASLESKIRAHKKRTK